MKLDTQQNGTGGRSDSLIERRLRKRLFEAFDVLWDDFVDPREAMTDVDGQWWTPVGQFDQPRANEGFATEGQLHELRTQCRRLAVTNEFAINGHENRISYIVGPGHNYQVTVRKCMDAPADVTHEVQAWLDRFLEVNRWRLRQQEIVRRMDRDGEAFLRFFVDLDGMTRIRFVEPEQISTPAHLSNRTAASFGILTEPDDVETVLGYYVDGELVDAEQIQ